MKAGRYTYQYNKYTAEYMVKFWDGKQYTVVAFADTRQEATTMAKELNK